MEQKTVEAVIEELKKKKESEEFEERLEFLKSLGIYDIEVDHSGAFDYKNVQGGFVFNEGDPNRWYRGRIVRKNVTDEQYKILKELVGMNDNCDKIDTEVEDNLRVWGNVSLVLGVISLIAFVILAVVCGNPALIGYGIGSLICLCMTGVCLKVISKISINVAKIAKKVLG